MSALAHLVSYDPATYADVEAAPPHYIVELVGGRLHAMSRPRARHLRAESRLNAQLSTPYDWGEGGPGGWWILTEPEVHWELDTVVTVPDLAGWRKEKMSDLPGDHKFRVVPDWICEILSPSTRQYDLNEKMPLYAAYGAPYLWLVDPDDSTVRTYRLDNNQWTLTASFSGSEFISAEPFEAVSFRLFDQE